MKLISFLILGLCYFTGYAQQNITIPKNADSFYGVDDFDAVYYEVQDALFKVNNLARFRFYDIQLGQITSVDLINPLKVLVFYEETQTVLLLDNRLNELERIDLKLLKPYRYIDHVSLAGERRLWMHNQDENVIELFNYVENRLIVRSPILPGIVENFYTDYNFCHVAIADAIHTYNTYGSRTGKIDVPPSSKMGYDFEKLVACHDQQVGVYEFSGEFRFRESGKIIIPPEITSIKNLYLKAGKLYLWDGKTIHHLSVNLNKD